MNRRLGISVRSVEGVQAFDPAPIRQLMQRTGADPTRCEDVLREHRVDELAAGAELKR